MKEVKAFMLENGEVFTDRGVALRRERQLQMEQDIRAFAEKVGPYVGDQDTIYDAIMSHPEEILKILKKYHYED